VNPPETDAAALFDRLFSEGTEGADASVLHATTALRVSALDAVWTDAKQLSLGLGSRDRVRLEQHMDHLRAIETRLQADVSSCGVPRREALAPAEWDEEPLAERMLLMSELVAVATACDLTRVFSLLFTGSVGYTMFSQVGATREHHAMSHESTGDHTIFDATTLFTMEQLAVLLQRFADTPEGDGNLLDHMVVLATSDTSNAAAHSVEDMPIIIAGGASGALKTPGVPDRGIGDNTNEFLLTVLRAACVPFDEFGRETCVARNGISDFLA
jgi:hypothetical protein